jgi:hypothetical protein
MAIKVMKCGHCGKNTDNPDKHTCPQSKPKQDYPDDFIDALRLKAALDENGIELEEAKAFFSPQYIAKYVLDLRKRILAIENFIGQNYPQDISALKGFYGEFGHRLKIIEDLFEGKSFKPIHDAMETHVEMFNERIEKLEDYMDIEDRITATSVLMRLDEVEKRAGFDLDKLKDHVSGVQDTCSHNNAVLCKDINKIEQYIYGEGDIGALVGRIENLEKNDTFDDNQRDVLEKRINKLESHFSGDYQLVASKLNPHKCPICYGEGNIYKQEMPSVHDTLFGWQKDAMGTAYKPCKSCDGKGIIWG